MTFIVAICGVDGVGKSSIARALQEQGYPHGASFLKKDNKRNDGLVLRHHRREHRDYRDINAGQFATLLSLAAGLDFLWHYEANIAPVIATNEIPFLVLDRFTPCYATYLHCVDPDYEYRSLFHRVRKADLTLLVEVDDDVRPSRYAMRGGATEDENEWLMQASAVAYRTIVPEYSHEVRTIRNMGEFPETMTDVIDAIRDVFGTSATGEPQLDKSSVL